MERENLSFPEAIRSLLIVRALKFMIRTMVPTAGRSAPRLMDVCDATAAFYHMQLMRGHDGRAREYFASRGMGAEDAAGATGWGSPRGMKRSCATWARRGSPRRR